MSTEIQPEELEYINPAEWQVRGQLRHTDGLVYGRGEPLPPITLAEALRYEQVGSLVRLRPDGTTEEPPRRAAAPSTALGYLHNRDEGVLRAIREHRPDLRTIQEILVGAKAGGRSFTLRFALELILLYGGVEHPHADPPRD